MKDYSYLEKIYNFADENGFKSVHVTTTERRNKRGYYDFVEITLVVPKPSQNKPTSADEAQKEEVTNNDI